MEQIQSSKRVHFIRRQQVLTGTFEPAHDKESKTDPIALEPSAPAPPTAVPKEPNTSEIATRCPRHFPGSVAADATESPADTNPNIAPADPPDANKARTNAALEYTPSALEPYKLSIQPRLD